MQSPKYTFYLSQNNNILIFDKKNFLNKENKIKWSEIHITQFIIHPKFKNEILLIPNDYCSSICLSIENFNENINVIKETGKIIYENYTLNLLDISIPYNYNGKYSSKIINNENFIKNENNIELKIKILIDGDEIDNYFYVDDEDANTSTIFEIELFFK